MKHVLAVDDSKVNCAMVRDTLQTKYEVSVVSSGKKALQFLETKEPDLILLDYRMPEMDGMEVLAKIMENPIHRDIPIIFLTSETTVEMETNCLKMGAIDFIGKPFAPATLMARVTRTLELEDYRHSLEKKVEEKTAAIKAIQRNIVINLAEIIESRDMDSGRHVKRTSGYVEIMARSLIEAGLYQDILTEEYVEMLVEAAVLHDIGKISIKDEILCKPGLLTVEEFEEVKGHAKVGERLVKKCLAGVTEEMYIQMASEMAKYHHERWDGKGYPNRLKREEIPLCARIMTISDVFDALVSKRCYKEAYGLEKAFKILKEERRRQFDPILTDVFLLNRDKFVEVLEKYLDDTPEEFFRKI